ncbi:MAG: PEP-CTERM sorting domain-containing protein [Pirellulales bacterium]|nr:PEP-CTERM sorting domain-containing protein [Pirellulales bacterium]
MLALATCAWLRLAPGALAATVPANFQGDAQTFSASVTGSGHFFADGGGVAPVGGGLEPFFLTPPLDHPLQLLDGSSNPGVAIDSHPRSVAIPKIDAPYRFDHQDPPAKVGDPPNPIFYVYYEPATGDGVDPATADPYLDGDGNPVVFTIDGGVPSKAPPKVFGFSQTTLQANGQAVSDIQNLDLDIFNGQTADFKLSQVVITSNSNNGILANIPIGVQGTLKELLFEQTGAATLTPTGAGTGTFSVDGVLSATATNLKALVYSVLPVGIGDQKLSQPFSLTGTYTIGGSPNDPNAKISLDGNAKFSYTLGTVASLATELTEEQFIPLTVSVLADVGASINFDIGFHLERVGVIPEPGSIVLLGLGLASVVPFVLHRRKQARRS